MRIVDKNREKLQNNKRKIKKKSETMLRYAVWGNLNWKSYYITKLCRKSMS